MAMMMRSCMKSLLLRTYAGKTITIKTGRGSPGKDGTAPQEGRGETEDAAGKTGASADEGKGEEALQKKNASFGEKKHSRKASFLFLSFYACDAILAFKDAFELILFFLQECVINDGTFINHEYNDVYLVTIIDPIPLDAFTLQELQELHSALEETKADIVGLWALKFLIGEGLLPKSLVRSMYVSFLAGCFRSVRFGLEEAHGKGQALQFNYMFEKIAFVLQPDETFSIDFDKVEDVVESLSREILTVQARGDKDGAQMLLKKYGVMTPPLQCALQKLETIQVPVDIVPEFPVADQILRESH
ncbi:PREDICTED: nudix hydrolase 3-like [Ipomoea nil]|uniref:nudix hydrolase 3-like n=1 Tax=Ipomoea nil TaxID=35883 RepID=UPI0009009854|nr:PREDICTED: nudix hydrolase 3-like [Ipomoea nil]